MLQQTLEKLQCGTWGFPWGRGTQKSPSPKSHSAGATGPQGAAVASLVVLPPKKALHSPSGLSFCNPVNPN